MKVFFDTEFTGLHKDTTLISLGLIAEDCEVFYAELTDFNLDQVDEWIKENVIDNLLYPGNFDGETPEWYFRGDSSFISKKLLEWLSQFETVEWVSDVSHYDFVLLIDLLYGHGLNIPYKKHGASCHDINQDIAKYYHISELEAFDKSREDIVMDLTGKSVDGVKHNSLHDAEIIKIIDEHIAPWI